VLFLVQLALGGLGMFLLLRELGVRRWIRDRRSNAAYELRGTVGCEWGESKADEGLGLGRWGRVEEAPGAEWIAGRVGEIAERAPRWGAGSVVDP